MALQSSQRLPELLFYTKKSYRILQLQFYKGYPSIHIQPTRAQLNYSTSREFSIQNPILHAEDKELFGSYYYYIQRAKKPSFQKRNSTHRRQGDLLEIHPCVLQDIPGTPAASPYKGNSSYSRDIPDIPAFPGNSTSFSISRESTPFQHSPIRMHILQILQFDWFPQKLHRAPVEQLQTFLQTLHSSKKGRCCDIGHVEGVGGIADMPIGRNAIFVEGVKDKTLPRCQADILSRIELIPSFVLSSDNTNCKNDIQLFHQLFDELSIYRDYH